MDSDNLNTLLNLLKDIEKKKTNLQEYLSNLNPVSRQDLLKEIYDNILEHNPLLDESRKEMNRTCQESTPIKQSAIIQKIINEIQHNPSKKVFFLKEFLDKLQDISEADKKVLLNSLENTDINDLTGKMESLSSIFTLSG